MGERQPKISVAISRLIILAPVAVIVLMSVMAFELMLVSILSFFAFFFTIIFWSVVSYLQVPVPKTRLSFAVSLVILISTFFFALPLKVAAFANRPFMNAVASRISDGEKIDAPFYAGMYRFMGGEKRGPMQCLWTDTTVGDSVGFCHIDDGDPAEYISEWWIVPLGGGWYHIIED